MEDCYWVNKSIVKAIVGVAQVDFKGRRKTKQLKNPTINSVQIINQTTTITQKTIIPSQITLTTTQTSRIPH